MNADRLRKTCKHYNGRNFLIDKSGCEAGVTPKQLLGELKAGWFQKVPCIIDHDTDATCDKLELMTEAEIEAEEKSWDEAIKRVTVVMPLISKLKENNPNGGQGIDECPCCKGKLHWGIASSNHHAHLKCETENCISLME